MILNMDLSCDGWLLLLVLKWMYPEYNFGHVHLQQIADPAGMGLAFLHYLHEHSS